MNSKKSIIYYACWLTVVIASVQVRLDAQTADRNPLHLAPDHATLSVADWDKECQWYQHVLGFFELKQTKQTQDRKICYLGITGYRLDVLWQRDSVRTEARHQIATASRQQGWLNVEFNSSDMDGAYKYLLAQGIEVQVDRGTGTSIQHLKFLDPEGNEFGITAR